MSLIGNLDEIKLADVLRILASGRKSGLLTVSASGGQALLRFQRGAVVHASSGRLHGEAAVLDLFGWREGQLTFVPEDRSVTPNLTRSLESLIEEGDRVGEQLHRTRELIPTDRVVFQMGLGPADDKLQYPLGWKQWRVLRVLDGVRDVGELVEASRVPREEVLRTLVDLAEIGFLVRAEVQKVLRAQPQKGLFAGDSAAVDERFEAEWKRAARFAQGVQRVEVRTFAGRHLTLPVSFRAGLIREVQLPKAALSDLALREGEDVHVRPVG